MTITITVTLVKDILGLFSYEISSILTMEDTPNKTILAMNHYKL